MRRVPSILVLCLAVAAAAAIASTPGNGGGLARRARGDRFLGRTPGSRPIDFTVSLRLPGQRKLNRFLRDLNDPKSPQYRHYIGAAQFGKNFGLSKRVLADTRTRLQRLRIHVTRSFPQRTTMDARASAAVLRRVFKVRLLEYRDRLGHEFHAPTSPAVVPSELAAAVDGVAGLNSRPAPRPLDVPVQSGFKPVDFARAYDFERLWRLGDRGAGQTIAVFSQLRFSDADIEQFDREVGISKPGVCSATVTTGCVAHVPVNGGTTDESDAEDALDVETIHGVAPEAVVLNYETQWRGEARSLLTGVIDAVSQMVKDGRARIMSISYGLPDSPSFEPPVFTTADIRAAEKVLSSALARGVNIFVSSGDQGAFQCQSVNLDDHELCVAWPAESPSVIAVGGTLLDVRGDGSYKEEAGWQDTLSGWGGGGGLSPTFKRPPWQSSSVPGVKNRFSHGMRQIPDVAGSASGASGTFVVFDGQVQSPIGGTSASSPFWAAVTGLISQRAQVKHAGKLPKLAPLLYRLAKSGKPGIFHDVVRGGNRYYPATPGWDYVTGLGSPDVYNLANAIIASLKGR